MAECRAREEQEAKKESLARQKEALKGKVTAVTKKSAPKKDLTVETDTSKPPSIIESKPDKMLDDPYAEQKAVPVSELLEQDDEDTFDRDEEPPMTKEQLEEQSSNSVNNIQRLGDEDNSEDLAESMQKTMSSSQLKEMLSSSSNESEPEQPTLPTSSEDSKEGENENEKALTAEMVEKYFEETETNEKEAEEFLDDDDQNEREESSSEEDDDQREEEISKEGELIHTKSDGEEHFDPYAS